MPQYTKYCNRKSKMTLLRRSPVFCIGYVTFNHLAEVCHHTGTPLATVVDFHLHYILMEPLSMLVTHCCKVLKEKVYARMEKVNFQGHTAPHMPILCP